MVVTVSTAIATVPAARVDARRQSDAEVKARRLQVAQLFQGGLRVMEIVRQTGLSWGAVHAVIKKVQAGELPALDSASRGRKLGQGRALTCEQEANLRQLIRRHGPWFYRLGDRLWTQATVASLIEHKCGLPLSRRAVGNYLVRWGVERKSRKRHPAAGCTPMVRKWLEINYPKLQAAAQHECAEIWWLNKSVALKGKGWGEEAQTTDGNDKQAEKERTFRLLSATNDRGTLRWVVVAGNVTPEKQLRLIGGLSKDVRRNLVLIRGDLRDYGSKDLLLNLPRLNRDIKIFPPEPCG